LAPGPERISTPRIPPGFALSWEPARSAAMATIGGMNSRAWPTSSSWLLPAPSPRTLNRSGLRRTTSRAWVPIEPVDPRIASDRMSLEGTPRCHLWSVGWLEDQPKVVEDRRGHEQHGGDSVQDSAVAWEHGAHVLHTEVPFDQRLDEVAEGREDHDHDGQP